MACSTYLFTLMPQVYRVSKRIVSFWNSEETLYSGHPCTDLRMAKKELWCDFLVCTAIYFRVTLMPKQGVPEKSHLEWDMTLWKALHQKMFPLEKIISSKVLGPKSGHSCFVHRLLIKARFSTLIYRWNFGNKSNTFIKETVMKHPVLQMGFSFWFFNICFREITGFQTKYKNITCTIWIQRIWPFEAMTNVSYALCW